MANETKVVITAETAQAESALISLNRGVQSTAKEFLSLSGIAGVLSVGAIGAFVKKSIDAADELAQLSEKTGASVEALAGLKYAAEQNDTSLTSVANAAKKLSTNLAENPDLFARFGITATDTTGALMQLSDIFQSMPDGVEKSALAVKLMGKSGEEMIPLLNQGGEALANFVAEGQKIYPVTTQNAAAARQFNDDLAKMQSQLGGVGMTLAADVIPAFTWITENGIKPMIGGIKILAVEFAYSMQAIGLGIEYATSPSKWGKQGTAEFEARLNELKRIAEESKTEIAASMEGIGAAAAPASAPKAKGNGKQMLAELGGGDTKAANHQAQIDAAIEREKAKYERLNELALSFGKSEEEKAVIKAEFDLAQMEKEHAASVAIYGKNDEMDTLYQMARIERQNLAELEIEAIRKKVADKEEEERQRKMRADLSIANFSRLLRQKDYSDAMTMGEKLTAGLAGKSRAMFEINKGMALANATIKGYELILAAAADGAKWGGFVGAAIEGGLATAYVATQLDAINSTQFGGGGSISSAGGGGVPSQATSPGIPVSQQPVAAQTPMNVNINIGDNGIYSASAVRGLIDQINQQISDGAVINQIRVN